MPKDSVEYHTKIFKDLTLVTSARCKVVTQNLDFYMIYQINRPLRRRWYERSNTAAFKFLRSGIPQKGRGFDAFTSHYQVDNEIKRVLCILYQDIKKSLTSMHDLTLL